jgi:hypothetical protein
MPSRTRSESVYQARRVSIALLFAISVLSTAAHAQVGGISVKDSPHNAAGNGVADDTAAFNSAYAAAKAAKVPMVIPTGDYKFTSTLVWDGAVDVIGAGMGGIGGGRIVILNKTGNFVGIRITATGASGVKYSNFMLNRSGADSSNGIEVDAGDSTHWRLENIDIQNQGGHGLLIRSGKRGMVTNLLVSSNGGDGVKVDSGTGTDTSKVADSIVFTNIVSSINAGHGMNVNAGNMLTITGVVSQNNTQWGLRHNGDFSSIQAYSESNLAGAIKLDTGSQSNYLTVVNASGTGSQHVLEDLGTTNVKLDLAHGIFFMPMGWETPAIPPNPSVLPRMTQFDRDQLVNPPEGMMIWNITTAVINLRRAGTWHPLP